MAARNQQTHAKRARELAVKERRERKRAKKAERAAGGITPETGNDSSEPGAVEQAETAAPEWIR
jgi:hypothetical protein